jgi:hypothetical protein
VNYRNQLTALVLMVIATSSSGCLPVFMSPAMNARTEANAGAAVGEALGFAKECAVGQMNRSGPPVKGNLCNGTSAHTFPVAWGGAAIPGVKCLSSTATAPTKFTITVEANGMITCQ